MRAMSTITLSEAMLLAQRVVDLANMAGTPVAVCVMDLEYRPVATMAMDGVALEYVNIAKRKAETALRIGADTSTMTEPDWSPRDHMVMAARGLAVFRGGVLIDDNQGFTICAIGISALSEYDDEALGRAVEQAVDIVGGQLTLVPLPRTYQPVDHSVANHGDWGGPCDATDAAGPDVTHTHSRLGGITGQVSGPSASGHGELRR